MNKAELINAAAEKAGLSKKDTETAINAAIEVISDCLAEGDKVQLVGFGAFEVKSRAERIGRNPKTKESIKIPASKVPVFKPGKALKDIVARGPRRWGAPCAVGAGAHTRPRADEGIGPYARKRSGCPGVPFAAGGKAHPFRRGFLFPPNPRRGP